MKKIFVLLIGQFMIFPVQLGAAQTAPAKSVSEKAVFAGGCFWCMQPPFDRTKGVLSTSVGYTGGAKENPAYEEVSSGSTGHAESIEVTYDPAVVSYEFLLTLFWRNIDPTVLNRQFCDTGAQYRSAIFYLNDSQKKSAFASKAEIEKSGKFKAIYTEVVPATRFYPAEEYHQKYYLKNPVRYKFYRYNCGRDETLKKIWGSAPDH